MADSQIPLILKIIIFIYLTHSNEGNVNQILQKKPPFIQTHAEFWSFDNQMKAKLRDYSFEVQNYTKYFFWDKRLNPPRLPSLFREIGVKAPGGRSILFELNLRKGDLTDITKIQIALKDVIQYQGLEVVYSSDISFQDNLKIVHEYTLLKSGTGFKGKVEGIIKDLHFLVFVRFNLSTKTLIMEKFVPHCLGGLELNLTGIPKNRAQLLNEATSIAMNFYKESILDDVETLTHTAVEEAFGRINITEFLPKFNYSIDFDRFITKYEKSKTIDYCPSELGKASSKTIPIKKMEHLNVHPYLPFILTEAEMMSFERQLKEKLTDFVDVFLSILLENLISRDLGRAKIQDVIVEGREQGVINAEDIRFKFVNGWISNLYDFQNDNIEGIEFEGQKLTISWRIYHLDKIEFVQDFKAESKNNNFSGKVKISLSQLSYLLRIKIDLNDSSLDSVDFSLACNGLETIEIFGVDSKDRRLMEIISREAKVVFNENALDVVEKLLIQGIESALHTVKVGSYLPNWNYRWKYNKEDENDSSNMTIDACKPDQEVKISEQSNFLENFNRANVSYNPVPFIKSNLELRSFGDKLKEKLNNYLLQVFHEAKSVLKIQEFSDLKISDKLYKMNVETIFGEPSSVELFLRNSSIQDISDFFAANDVIDHIRFDEKNISFDSKIIFWQILNFKSNAIINTTEGIWEKNVTGNYFGIVHSISASLSYGNEAQITIDNFQLICGDEGLILFDDPIGSAFLDWNIMTAVQNISKIHLLDVMNTANKLLRRSIEDAVLRTDVRRFLPDWDFARIYNDIPARQPTTYFRPCTTDNKDGPHVETVYPDEKYVEFNQFHRSLSTEALRQDLRINIPTYIARYTRDLWFATWAKLQYSYVEVTLPDDNKILDVESDNNSTRLNLSQGKIKGISLVEKKNKEDVAYTNDADVVGVSVETFPELEVKYNFEVTTSEKVQTNGTIEMKLKNVKNLLKVRLNMNRMHYSVEDYDLFCYENLAVNVNGVPSEKRWLEIILVNEAMNTLMGNIIGDILDLRQGMLRDAAEKVDAKYAFPIWMTEDNVYKASYANETDNERQNKRKELIGICDKPELNNIFDDHIEYQGKLPFIQTEAEWWYFDNVIRRSVKQKAFKILSSVHHFMQDNAFEKLKLPNYTREYLPEGTKGSNFQAKVTFLNGMAEDMSSFLRDPNVNLEIEGEEVTVISYVKYTEKIKVHYDVKTNVNGEIRNGSVQLSAESLKYMFQVKINLKTRVVSLTDFQLICIGELPIEIKGVENMKFLPTSVIESFAIEMFLEPILDDIGKIIRIGLERGVFAESPKFVSLPIWNYNLNYPERRRIKQEKGISSLKDCESINSTEMPLIFINDTIIFKDE